MKLWKVHYNMCEQRHIVIVGGGITGLATAWKLEQLLAGRTDVVVTLLEKSHRLGGKIKTYTENGRTIEAGPDSFLTRKPYMKEWLQSLGLPLVESESGKAYVLRRKKLHPIPDGAVMGVPTTIRPFITSSLFSFQGKIAASKDFWKKPLSRTGDVSVGTFFSRRFGDEVLEALIEPLLSGIYAGNLDEMSMDATFPQFRALEKAERSLILGLRKTRTVSSVKKGPFSTVTTGLESVVAKIHQSLKSTRIILDTQIERVHRHNASWNLVSHSGASFHADHIIFTTPHENMRSIFSLHDLSEFFTTTPSTSVATAALVFSAKDLKGVTLDANGFVVSRREATSITACTWTSTKWPHTSNGEEIILRCYIGRPNESDIVHLHDDKILETVTSDLQKITGITAKPIHSYISRHIESMPQYTVGHLERMEKLQQYSERYLPQVHCIGAYNGGVGLPDRVKIAFETAQHIVTHQLKSEELSYE
ncbi:MAG: protoporphyrinogen oxidase [Bacilli bacterium]